MSEFLLSLLLAIPAEAAAKSWPLAKLEGAAVFLRHVADSEMKSGAQSSCGLDSAEALRLTQPLKALRDQAIARERKTIKRTKKLLKAVSSCELKCHCGAYSDLLEGLPGWSVESSAAALKASKETAESIAKCAKQEALWLCGSPLLTRLKKDAPPAQ